ncbi:WxL domain-containing protein [Enterococcus faecalis]|uniref:WxL domain-containing protein n=1 Tax=Enterococcus faecalis TaxID=1351 RepID=UPI002955C879|nr:WxL domain-containing protein [Enterococcus faecalis]MDV7871566.1 WxL domain-containing protein [Enterococcus faecalis]
MKQIKFKHLATLGLCCSLLVNSFTGITVVAETVTIESSPTTESTKESTEKSTKESTRETESQTNQTEEKTSKEEVNEEEVVSEKQETTETVEEGNSKIMETINKGESLIQPKQISPKAEKAVEQTTTIPPVTYKFGFVNEKGVLVAPSFFVIKTNLTTVINETPKQVGTATGINNGNLKHLMIPSQILTYTPDVKPAFFGATDFSLETPKYYKMPTITPGTHYKGSTTAYPIATTKLKFVSSTTENEIRKDGQLYSLQKIDVANSYRMYRASWVSDTTNTLFAHALKMSTTKHSPAYYTTDDTMYYFVENRRVTENFVDATGAKITPPTGFTQGKQTVIDSSPYTFKQSGTLPYVYKINNKPYVLKGWYKGKTKPEKLNQITSDNRNISYPVTYDDQDDVTVVYDEVKLGGNTIQFGFVNEQGKYIPPTSKFNVSTDVGVVTDATFAKLQTVNSSVKGNYLSLTIPAYNPTGGIGQGQTYYGTLNSIVTIPKYYKTPTLTPPSNYQGTAYPAATGVWDSHNGVTNVYSPSRLSLTPESNSQTNYQVREVLWGNEVTKTGFSSLYKMSYNNISETAVALIEYYATGTVNYYLENRRVTENFVDATGTKITPPTGFTQGKQTVIDSDPYTFKQSGTLPDTYKANGKTYKFKGWYKGKTNATTPLETSKTPSYKVTYDDNDDLNVVYEEVNFSEATYQFGFVNEAGELVNPADINITYDYKSIAYRRGTGGADATVSFGTLATNQSATTVGNLKNVTLPATSIARPIESGWNGDGYSNFSIKLPRYYQSLSLYDKTGKINPSYPLPVYTRNYSNIANEVMPEATVINYLTVTQRTNQSYTPKETYLVVDPSVKFPEFLLRVIYSADMVSGRTTYGTFSSPVYYHLTNRKVTENFVDATGAKITPPTGFTQGKQTVIDSDNFTYTSAKALPASYTADGKTYLFQGWYKGSEKPATLETSKTPSYSVTYNDQDDLTAVYKEASISANVTMRGAVEVIDNGATMEYWEVLLKNTGEAPLTSIKIKPTADWESGISAPTELFILGTGQNAKARPITKEQWEAGFEIPLDSSLPVGGQLTINLIGTKVTGQPDQVLKAAVEVSGNFNKLTASDTVRIKDLDQETKEPTGEGFISVPTFDFGQVDIASATKQHGLKKAADYYGNGTRNPYVRINKTQPNWSLTAQLSQPKSAADSLPTATRLLLGAAPVSSFSNYNQPTELKNTVGTTSAINLTANNAATSIIANQQFTGSDVYQLDFAFDNVKLEVPANQGTAGQQYQAAVTWNLVTGP